MSELDDLEAYTVGMGRSNGLGRLCRPKSTMKQRDDALAMHLAGASMKDAAKAHGIAVHVLSKHKQIVRDMIRFGGFKHR